MDEPVHRYKLTGAWAQCGTTPPYRCLPMKVRMEQGVPQILAGGEWIDFPKDGPRPTIARFYGMPVAGIASDWETDHG